MAKKGVKIRGEWAFVPEYCEFIIEHCSIGHSVWSFAGKIGVPKWVLLKWRQELPEFRESWEVAEEFSRLYWEQKSIEALNSESKINATVLVFNLKNRFADQWKDQQLVTQDHKVSFEPMSPDELREAIKVDPFLTRVIDGAKERQLVRADRKDTQEVAASSQPGDDRSKTISR